MEPDAGMEQREGADDLFDRRHLGGVALQEFQTRGDVREQVAHLDDDAGQQGSGSLLDELTRADAQPGAGARTVHVSDRRDACERLAAKSKRLDRDQVGDLRELARRVADECQRELVRRYAAAIIADAARRFSGTPRSDSCSSSSRVELVPDEFLYGGGRP